MGSCSACGAHIDIVTGYSCNYCTGTYCTDHRLPEQHFCPGMEEATSLGPEMRPGRSSQDTDVQHANPGLFWTLVGFLLLPLVLLYDFVSWSLQSWTRLLIGSAISAVVFFSVVMLLDAL